MALKFIAHFEWISIALNPPGGDTDAVGRGGRLLLRRDAHARRRRDPAEGALARRPAAAVRGDRVRRRRASTRYPELDGARRGVRRARSPTPCRRCAHLPGPEPGGPAPARRSSTRRGCGGSSRSMLDEDEFLGPHGIRAISRHHLEHPCVFDWDGQEYEVRYLPAESDTGMFGGNSNWRGPVWFPMNLVILRGAAAAAPLLRRPAQGRVPDRLRARDEPARGRDRDRPAPGAHVHRRRGRPPAGVRRDREVPDRPALARPAAVPRVLPRRQRRRASAPATRPAGPGPWRCCSDARRRAARSPARRRRARGWSRRCACPPRPTDLRDQHRGLAERLGRGAAAADAGRGARRGVGRARGAAASTRCG